MGTEMIQTLFDKYVVKGGPLMFLLVPCSILMVGAVLQEMLRLRRGRVIPRAILDQARAVGDGEARRSFLEKLADHGSPLAQAVNQTVSRFGPMEKRPREELLRGAMGDSINAVTDRLYDGLALLGTIYTVAPLLGLLGTIQGMMQTFYVFAVENQKSVEMLSKGIMWALITTLWGLSIAIPAFIAVMYFQWRIRRYEREELSRALREIMNAVWPATPPEAESMGGGLSPAAEEIPLNAETGT